LWIPLKFKSLRSPNSLKSVVASVTQPGTEFPKTKSTSRACPGFFSPMSQFFRHTAFAYCEHLA
jgi:hypothetical protein